MSLSTGWTHCSEYGQSQQPQWCGTASTATPAKVKRLDYSHSYNHLCKYTTPFYVTFWTHILLYILYRSCFCDESTEHFALLLLHRPALPIVSTHLDYWHNIYLILLITHTTACIASVFETGAVDSKTVRYGTCTLYLRSGVRSRQIAMKIHLSLHTLQYWWYANIINLDGESLHNLSKYIMLLVTVTNIM